MLGAFIVVNLVVMLGCCVFERVASAAGDRAFHVPPAMAIVAIKFVKEESQKRFIKGAFSYYLSPSVIDKSSRTPSPWSWAGRTARLPFFSRT